MRFEVRYKGRRIGEVTGDPSFQKLNDLLESSIDATEIENFSLHPVGSEDPEAK